MNKILNILSLIVTLSLVTISCVDRDYNDPELSCGELNVNKTVQEVYGVTTSTATKYEQDHIIEAYVTGSDDGGNFYKTISLMSLDGTRGFNMPLNVQTLFAEYEPGRKVYVRLNNLYTTIDNSALSIGNQDPNYVGRVQRLFDYQVARVIQRSCTRVDENSFLKTGLSINTIKNDNYLHTLIELDNVQFDDDSLGKTYFDTTLPGIGGSEHQIIDEQGNKIMVRISEFAVFGGRLVPSGSGKIRGVLTKFGSTYQFMIRTTEDVNMTSPRFGPIFKETFSSNFGLWTKVSLLGTQEWFLETQFGNPAPCAVMNGFSGGSNANEDWLISPSIDLFGFTTATLKFDTASRFSGNLLQVFVSTNYNSGNPSSATWTQLNGFTLDTNTGSFIWTNSGNINVSSFVGNPNFRVAFKYTSTNSASTTWEVDNVIVDAE